ncbi:hypothetical protein SKAU_G00215680 [Synaphobranchus kaupii]|uniref:Uncharacterized protein n=1 Tax=Synaphobranchus kaupii TaxID=118154 RepID=A0A9Q1IVD4_SYNKA|nr:hypothetical protein SKAU_G00215680 [Synaphobranchus kaupii]
MALLRSSEMKAGSPELLRVIGGPRENMAAPEAGRRIHIPFAKNKMCWAPAPSDVSESARFIAARTPSIIAGLCGDLGLGNSPGFVKVSVRKAVCGLREGRQGTTGGDPRKF